MLPINPRLKFITHIPSVMETQDTRSKTAVENELLENQYVSMMINDFKRRVFWGDKTVKPNNNVLIKLLIKDKMTIAEVSEMLGRNPATITVWMDGFGIKKSDYLEARGDEIKRMYTVEKKSANEIAKHLSVSMTMIRNYLKSKNLRPAKPRKKELNRLLIEEKMTIAEVSEMLGRSPATIMAWMDKFRIKKSDHMDMLGERIVHMYTSGKTVSEISHCLSLSIATVKKHLKSKNLPRRY